MDKGGRKRDGSRISVVTLGCSKNIVDSEVLLGQLKLNDANIVEDVNDAEVAVINTCGFIESAKQESIDAILEAVRRKNEGRLKKVVVMGCLSERFAKELRVEIPEVDAYFGSNQLSGIAEELGIDFQRELLGERRLTTPAHFAYLKISEGCDNPCSFCAIPLMRGVHRTKPLEDILHEARLLASTGVKELILIGQDTTSYGLDLYGERRLETLLRELSSIEGVAWIRLMYAYPAKFPRQILNVFKDHPKICRYLDIPVQHISDEVLKSMQRGISGRALRELLQFIRTEVPDIALRSTLIVGYPNETDRRFAELCDFVREMKFHRLGVFTYSREEGTTAYDLGDPIPQEVKKERLEQIMEIQQEISAERNRLMIGTEAKVLLERVEGDLLVGRTEWDAPEIDQEVFVSDVRGLGVGDFCWVNVIDASEYDLYAVAAE
ncbi:MAG TPA: 30S ribosomal protein S12 methylthiotransferase RimO [Bacteroidetes bacterium]|nr:30S ribosomal protein S12 methylthiotransferase RimO [Bacteroidota bacterium]